MIILAIESSCDETGVGIAELGDDGTVTLLADEVASSVDEHARFGGVVPEIASRARNVLPFSCSALPMLCPYVSKLRGRMAPK